MRGWGYQVYKYDKLDWRRSWENAATATPKSEWILHYFSLALHRPRRWSPGLSVLSTAEYWGSHRIIPSGCCCSSSCSQSSCWWWPVERGIWLGTLMGTVWGELKIFQEKKYFTNKILHPGTTSMILMMITTAYSIYTTMMTMETVVHRVAFLFIESFGLFLGILDAHDEDWHGDL